MSWTLWDQPFHKKPWYGTFRKPWGNGVEPWEKVVESWGKRWNREKSSARLWGTFVWLLHGVILGYHQKNHSLYHGSYAWFLTMLPGSYWTSRWGPVTYETSPQEVLGYIYIYRCMYTHTCQCTAHICSIFKSAARVVWDSYTPMADHVPGATPGFWTQMSIAHHWLQQIGRYWFQSEHAYHECWPLATCHKAWTGIWFVENLINLSKAIVS